MKNISAVLISFYFIFKWKKRKKNEMNEKKVVKKILKKLQTLSDLYCETYILQNNVYD